MLNRFVFMLLFISAIPFVNSAERPNTLNFKLGSIKLTETSQTINGLNVTFTEKSDAAWGVEYRIFINDLIAFGVDSMSFIHSYQVSGQTGEMRTGIILGNAEIRWDVASGFKPYLSVGAGLVGTSFSGGPLSGHAGGIAASLRGGVDLPLNEYLGFEFELRSISAKPEDSNSHNKVDLASRAAFLGFSLYF